jgi:predicted HTH domain antitoxin
MAATRATARTITIELPEDLVAALESLDGIEDRAWKALVLDLLRDGAISQGRAARLLGVTRYDILDLMASHHIPSGPLTAEEMRQDIENARRFARPAATVDSGQQQEPTHPLRANRPSRSCSVIVR